MSIYTTLKDVYVDNTILYNTAKGVVIMIHERIKMLREQYNYSQADLAKKLGLARTSVIAWENETSVPSMKHIIEMAKLFRVTTDYLLEVNNQRVLSLDGLSEEEINIICGLLNYFDKKTDAYHVSIHLK